MTSFRALDGTQLAYSTSGTGVPLICLPGGPMQSAAYLGDLGGLTAYCSLVGLDLRGTGASGVPDDPASYRCDRQVDDVEALRLELGLERIDLLAHSAGAAIAVLYAARHPERIRRLVLVTPSPAVVGVEIADVDRREIAELRRGDDWFPESFAAFERIWSGALTDADWDAISPFVHGHWDESTRADVAQQDRERNDEAAGLYYSDGALDPAATRSALARLDAPVLLISGAYDVSLPPKNAAAYADLFADAELAVIPAAGHFPWRDDPIRFTQTLAAFLA